MGKEIVKQRERKQLSHRSVGIQTELIDAGICAFVTVEENFLVYNVNCCYCDASFPVSNWNKFMLHIDNQHRHKDETFHDGGLNFEEESFGEDIIEIEITAMAIDNNHQDIDPMEIEAIENIGKDSQNDIEILQAEENKEDSWPENAIEFVEICDNDSDVDSAPTSDAESNESLYYKQCLPNRNKEPEKLKVDSSDPVIICGLLDLLESYPVLWFVKIREHSEDAIVELLLKFNEKFQLELTMGELCDSLRDISSWYRGICEKQDADKLSYPQSEYFRKCSKFLPDKLDGITCVHCQRLMPDHLLYFIHKKCEHPNSLSASDEADERNSKFQGIARTKINNYMEGRYTYDSSGNKVSYQCQVCYFDCKRKHRYIEHIKWHLNVRDHVCDICGATFVRKMGLANHKKRHFGLLQSVCKICNKVCNDAQLLSMHRQTYHRPIEGTIEEIEANLGRRKGRTAKGFSKYKTRIDPKTNQRRYVCDYCDKDYKLQPGLFQHLKLHHKDEYRPTVNRFERKITKPTKKIIKVEKIQY